MQRIYDAGHVGARVGGFGSMGAPASADATVDTSMEILEVVLQVQPVVRPRHAVHPGRGLRLKRGSTRPADDRRQRGAAAR